MRSVSGSGERGVSAQQPDLSAVHVVVPIRGVGGGKSRLGAVLDPEERSALVMGMLVHTLTVLSQWHAAAAVWLVTGDAAVATAARRFGRVAIVEDPLRDGLNGALSAASGAAAAAGATAVLFLPADLPLLGQAALDALLEAADATLAAGNGRPIVVVAPADARNGTNALLVSPPGVIDPAFGPQSLEAHLRAGAVIDASMQLVIDPALGFDLDTPDDLLRLEADRLLELQRLGELDAAPVAASPGGD
jgi:2-phospho-L-lactate/phosphoenolpyruvate guanylyltransferase